jgi:hypothetical protein
MQVRRGAAFFRILPGLFKHMDIMLLPNAALRGLSGLEVRLAVLFCGKSSLERLCDSA